MVVLGGEPKLHTLYFCYAPYFFILTCMGAHTCLSHSTAKLLPFLGSASGNDSTSRDMLKKVKYLRFAHRMTQASAQHGLIKFRPANDWGGRQSIFSVSEIKQPTFKTVRNVICSFLKSSNTCSLFVMQCDGRNVCLGFENYRFFQWNEG